MKKAAIKTELTDLVASLDKREGQDIGLGCGAFLLTAAVVAVTCVFLFQHFDWRWLDDIVPTIVSPLIGFVVACAIGLAVVLRLQSAAAGNAASAYTVEFPDGTAKREAADHFLERVFSSGADSLRSELRIPDINRERFLRDPNELFRIPKVEKLLGGGVIEAGELVFAEKAVALLPHRVYSAAPSRETLEKEVDNEEYGCAWLPSAVLAFLAAILLAPFLAGLLVKWDLLPAGWSAKGAAFGGLVAGFWGYFAWLIRLVFWRRQVQIEERERNAVRGDNEKNPLDDATLLFWREWISDIKLVGNKLTLCMEGAGSFSFSLLSDDEDRKTLSERLKAYVSAE